MKQPAEATATQKRMADRTVAVYQRIATFEESIEAAKIVSRALEDGLLDDAGKVAEITPEEFIIKHAEIVGVVVTIRSSSPIPAGVFASGRFVRHDFAEGSNVEPLPPRSAGGRPKARPMIETKVEIPVKAA